MNTRTDLNIGTCSWKYDSWKGIIYSDNKTINYLQEYSQHYSTVEVDQWFWSLFKKDQVVFPRTDVVREYAASVPNDFTFSVKVPNSITLTHHYNKGKNTPLEVNPYFLSNDLMTRFIETLEPIHSRIACIMFQFEYLNKQKMESLDVFLDQLKEFTLNLPYGFNYGVEIRNPNYLTPEYFQLLDELNLIHVFLQGYYMPSIFSLYEQYKKYINGLSVIRLHGSDRKGIEKITGKDWSQIVCPQDDDIVKLKGMLEDLSSRNSQVFLYVNNHFEGSAPRTIQKIISD